MHPSCGCVRPEPILPREVPIIEPTECGLLVLQHERNIPKRLNCRVQVRSEGLGIMVIL